MLPPPNSSTRDDCPKSVTVGTGAQARTIAVRTRSGGAPGLLWLGGFRSDMNGIKAQALDAWAKERSRAMVRFDYSGHGESGGSFAEGTIGRWLEESLAVFDAFCRGPQVVIGSSMGGWLALLMARALARREGARREEARHAGGTEAAAALAGLVLIAPAVDFTEELIWKRLPAEAKREMEETGAWSRASAYSAEPHVITRALIDEGRHHLLLDGLIETRCPVRILQGVLDPDVPWRHALELTARFAQDDVVLSLIKDGDHRLSRPDDIERLLAAVAEF